MATVTAEYQSLGQSLQNLRQIKGHWDGGDQNPAVDNFNGEKHQVLQKLGEYFGKPGVPAANILSTMGQPDEIKQTMDEAFQTSLMPGPVVGGTGAAALSYGANSTGAGLGDVSTTMMPSGSSNAGPQVMYFIYKWRGNHDYLWFKIDAEKEEVLESSWYHAYE
ncbi:hypothetical protein EMPS_03742 [Entomortierella parvispora]|uniref:Uncharacterized protein n=1 Tax=Entomortierella parvispora TaxID=205924 RepID=A0A9P3LUW0_9FUNG|nr:hypothetical protein EMPS_03742 [Entomortierella parvispora]